MPLFRSKDRVHWRHIGAAFPKDQQPKWWQDWQPANAKKTRKTGKLLSGEHNPNVFIWAPHLARHNGTYHLYYAIPASFGLHRAAASAMRRRPRSIRRCRRGDGEPVITCDDNDPFNAIDPFFIVDQEGKAWMPFGSFAPPFHSTLRPAGSRPGRRSHGRRSQVTASSAPAMWFDRKSDRYYLFASEGFGIGQPWDYKVRVWRTKRGADHRPVPGPPETACTRRHQPDWAGREEQ